VAATTSATFSTLPRVVVSAGPVAGTQYATLTSFQYPTTGRRVCRLLPGGGGCRPGDQLSVPYHGSSCLPAAAGCARGGSYFAFSTLPRVVVSAGQAKLFDAEAKMITFSTLPRVVVSAGSRAPAIPDRAPCSFQYPTTGRRVCRSVGSHDSRTSLRLSVPYHGSSCLPGVPAHG